MLSDPRPERHKQPRGRAIMLRRTDFDFMEQRNCFADDPRQQGQRRDHQDGRDHRQNPRHEGDKGRRHEHPAGFRFDRRPTDPRKRGIRGAMQKADAHHFRRHPRTFRPRRQDFRFYDMHRHPAGRRGRSGPRSGAEPGVEGPPPETYDKISDEHRTLEPLSGNMAGILADQRRHFRRDRVLPRTPGGNGRWRGSQLAGAIRTGRDQRHSIRDEHLYPRQGNLLCRIPERTHAGRYRRRRPDHLPPDLGPHE